MDALTSAALDNLTTEALPRLLEQLISLRAQPIEIRQPTDELKAQSIEARELLDMLIKWLEAGTSAQETIQAGGDIGDDEAYRLLAEMDAPAAAPVTSDDEARRLLAEMDAPLTPAAATADDDAMAMLKALGGVEDGGDESTPAAITEAPAPAAAPPADDLAEIPEWESNDFANDPEMMNDFSTNTNDLMQTLDDTVLKLEQNPEDKETIEEIFRAAHTLKGGAGMFGFRGIERVMHRMENLFDNVRKGKLVPNADTIDVVFQGLDILKKLLAAVHAGTPSGVKTVPVVRALELAAVGKSSGLKRSGASKENVPQAEQAAVATATTVAPAAAIHDDPQAPKKQKNEANSTIRVDLERLDALVNLIGELVIDRTRFISIEEHLRVQQPQNKLASNMTETLQLFGRHMNEIQDIIMKVRMVPVGSVFNKYPRIVRDLARQLDKKIDLVIHGEETEFDKTLVEQIADPLVHLIRNACDHGVETPDARLASGKNGTGTVTLSARQEGNHILIQIDDDGKGMDPHKIKAKAIEKGLISADQQLSERDMFNLIFEPGFSTAEKVTTVSGRGVGMDVVKKQISKLKGLVEIASKPGKGSSITIQLPLTLAIMQSLLIGVRDETFAVPLATVIESIRIKPSDIQKIGDAEVIKLRNNVLPLLYLDDALDLDKKASQQRYQTTDSSQNAKYKARRNERLYVVVVGSAERRFGLVVDRLLNQQEMVIKPLGTLMQGTSCVAGGAVLGNGEVVLVIDIPEVEQKFRMKQRIQAA